MCHAFNTFTRDKRRKVGEIVELRCLNLKLLKVLLDYAGIQ